MSAPKEIREEVRQVLLNVRTARTEPVYLTAYQIFTKLSEETKNRLLSQYVQPGRGAGRHYSAASAVSDAAEMLPDIDIKFFDTTGLRISCGDDYIEAGNVIIGIYRLPA